MEVRHCECGAWVNMYNGTLHRCKYRPIGYAWPVKDLPKKHRKRVNLANPQDLIDLLKSQRHCCELCGGTNILQVHHKVPRRLGGTDALDNLRLVCRDCHLFVIHRTPKGGTIHSWEAQHA